MHIQYLRITEEPIVNMLGDSCDTGTCFLSYILFNHLNTVSYICLE